MYTCHGEITLIFSIKNIKNMFPSNGIQLFTSSPKSCLVQSVMFTKDFWAREMTDSVIKSHSSQPSR